MLDEAAIIPWSIEEITRYRKCCWKNQTILERFIKAGEEHGFRKDILYSADYGDAHTYIDLIEGSERLAANLLELGIKPRYVALFQLNNTPLFFYLWFALTRLGAAPLHIDTRFRLKEISAWGKTLEAEIYVMPGSFRKYDYYELAENLKKELPSLKFVLTPSTEKEGVLSIEKLLRQTPSPQSLKKLNDVRIDPYKVSHLLLSGGTTGLPKVIPRTHADYIYGAEILGRLSAIIPNTRTLIVTELTHNLAFVYSLATFFYGGRIYLTDKTDAESLLKNIQNHRITFFVGVPTLYIRILRCEKLKNYDVSSLQVCLSGGQAMPIGLAEEIERKLGCRFQNLYGVSEGFSMLTRLDDPEDIRFKSAGRPSSPYDDVKLLDPETGVEVGEGQAGELCVKGPRVIKGYYKDPIKNKESFTSDGYFRTGDLLMRDANGYYFFVGRTKDIINRGGLKVGAEEIEGYVEKHPKVREAAAVGMPDPEMGEKVCVYIVPEDFNNPPTLDEIRDFLNKLGVAKYKWPERLELINELPKSTLGKKRRAVLKEDLKKKIFKSS